MGRQQKYVIAVGGFDGFRGGLLVVVHFVRAGVRGRLEALLHRGPQIGVHFGDAIFQVADQSLLDAGVEHGHRVGVRGL